MIDENDLLTVLHFVIADEGNSDDFFDNPNERHPLYLALKMYQQLEPKVSLDLSDMEEAIRGKTLNNKG